MRKNSTRAIATAVVAAGLLATGGSAFAADTTDAVVTGGSLTITAPAAADFGAVALDGTATTTTATLDAFTVNDATGTGAGWNVTAQATQFTAVGGKTLATDSLTLSAPTVAASGTTSTTPTVAAGPYAIGEGAVKVATAAVDTGMGAYDFGATTMELSLPASVYAGTYTSTVTVSVTTGP